MKRQAKNHQLRKKQGGPRSRSPKGAGRGGLTLMASIEEQKRSTTSLQGIRISDLYKPLKKPVTLRLDADVLAWFKKDGRRYQTRINAALRRMMEQEMKES
jgi:uncharacterized protein (DUF4415 family)